MKIEHFGLAVKEPITMANWYVAHLGFVIRRSWGDNQNGGAFISNSSQDLASEPMIEIYNNNNVTSILGSPTFSPLTLHIAVNSSDPDADLARLEKAGAVFIERNEKKPQADELIFLRDPWGNVIQLVKRCKAF
jgi:glyoxylase I family protein